MKFLHLKPEGANPDVVARVALTIAAVVLAVGTIIVYFRPGVF